MITTSPTYRALRCVFISSSFFALFLCQTAMAQSRTPAEPAPTPLAEAQAALERRDWAAAEVLLDPLVKAEPKNPFAYFELAQLYENTNRVQAAKNIYQAIAAIPEAEKANYVVIAVRENKKYMVLLPNLAQEKLASLASIGAAPAASPPSVPPSAPTAVVTARSAAPVIAQPVAMATALPSSSAIENTPPVMAMRQWIAAWQTKQLDAYFASYVPGYKGEMKSAAEWQKARAQRINTKTKININAYDVTTSSPDGQQVLVSFTQAYVSNTVVGITKKTLTLIRSNGRWLISKETSK